MKTERFTPEQIKEFTEIMGAYTDPKCRRVIYNPTGFYFKDAGEDSQWTKLVVDEEE